jgi:integrase
MDFMFHGQRIRESTGMTSKTRAKEVEEKRKQALKDGVAGIRKQQQPLLLSSAAESWQESKQLAWSPKMRSIVACSLKHLLPVLGKKLLVEIEARDVTRYQKARLAERAADRTQSDAQPLPINRTINIEVGILRQIMREHGQWARIQMQVKMLPERDDVGRALTAKDESLLLLECGRSRSRILLPFVVLALDTGARYNTVRTLQWANIDFSNRCLKFGRDKTKAGTGRTVPLNQRALETLKFWAQQFPSRLPEHYAFPMEKCSQSGTEEAFGFSGAVVYDTDPSQPIGDIKEAWEGAKKRTRRHCPDCGDGMLLDKPTAGYQCDSCQWAAPELPAGLVGVRFHDLRHTAVTRMISARVPLPIIAKVVGWSAGTMAKMAARYGHFGIEDLRTAVEAVSRHVGEIQTGYPQNPPQSSGGTGVQVN